MLNVQSHQDATSAATENSVICFGIRNDTKRFLLLLGLDSVLKREL